MVIGKILEFFFPTFCASCKSLGSYFCENCYRKLKFYPSDRCFYCRGKSAFGFTHPVCQKRTRLDGVFSLFYYNGMIQYLIKAIKYRKAYRVLDYFLENLPSESLDRAKKYFSLLGEFILVPIPLHKNRYLQRGFNQAGKIARFFGEKIEKEVKEILWRKKDNPPQAFLKEKKERFRNTRGLFAVNDGIQVPERIVLVDDLITTGKTMESAVETLKRRGARQVFGFALAKG